MKQRWWLTLVEPLMGSLFPLRVGDGALRQHSPHARSAGPALRVSVSSLLLPLAEQPHARSAECAWRVQTHNPPDASACL